MSYDWGREGQGVMAGYDDEKRTTGDQNKIPLIIYFPFCTSFSNRHIFLKQAHPNGLATHSPC